MMQCLFTLYSGKTYALPALLEWRFAYTAGVPCDSFWLRALWTAGQEQVLAGAVRLTAFWNGETVFEGLVDECECMWDRQGCTLEVSGRGRAALLLDNEALPADYQVATVTDILRDHVTPYGVEVAGRPALPAVSGFSVSTGSSEWQVIYEFARYYGGIAPRFDRAGRLVLAGWEDGRALCLDETVPVTSFSCREKRYGVLSEILVRDRSSGVSQRVENTAFFARGGRCRRVLTLPWQGSYQAMRYTGSFQIQKSEAERSRLSVTVPLAFFAWPGDLIDVKRQDFGRNGRWRALEVTVCCGEKGLWTKLELGEPGTMI